MIVGQDGADRIGYSEQGDTEESARGPKGPRDPRREEAHSQDQSVFESKAHTTQELSADDAAGHIPVNAREQRLARQRRGAPVGKIASHRGGAHHHQGAAKGVGHPLGLAQFPQEILSQHVLDVPGDQPRVVRAQGPVDQETTGVIHREHPFDAVAAGQSNSPRFEDGLIQVQPQLAGGEEDAHVPDPHALERRQETRHGAVGRSRPGH
jgi:hypothetical protein